MMEVVDAEHARLCHDRFQNCGLAAAPVVQERYSANANPLPKRAICHQPPLAGTGN